MLALFALATAISEAFGLSTADREPDNFVDASGSPCQFPRYLSGSRCLSADLGSGRSINVLSCL
jgi:hypothetical protein